MNRAQYYSLSSQNKKDYLLSRLYKQGEDLLTFRALSINDGLTAFERVVNTTSASVFEQWEYNKRSTTI